VAFTTVLKNTGPITLTKIWYEDGAQVDGGDVNVVIVDASGDVVQASTSATKTGSESSTSYTYSLAIQTTVNRLTVTWTRVDTGAVLTDTVEVVGDRLFSLTDARAFDGGALASTSLYTNATILQARDEITDLLEDWTGVSWIRRHARYDLPGSGTSKLRLRDFFPTQVIAASIDGTAQTVGDIVIAGHGPFLLHTTSTWSAPTATDPLNVTVEYEYGRQDAPDGVNRVGLLLLRDRLVPSAIPDAAISFQDEGGAYQMVREGGPMRNITRIPEVNAWLTAHTIPRVH